MSYDNMSYDELLFLELLSIINFFILINQSNNFTGEVFNYILMENF
jgi:hypothetical protein